jgi:hypothetical protein
MRKSSLKSAIASILRSDTLQPEEVAYLHRWLADPRADEIWSKIEAKAKKQHGAVASCLKLWFIREILGGLLVADHPPDANAMLKQAANAESLAKFLQGPRLPSLPPILPNSEALIESLVSASRTLREMAQRQVESGIRQVSRIDRNGSRKRGSFGWSIGETLNSYCGQPLDEAAAFFSDLASPSLETDADRIRNIRRPRTRTGRAKRQK